MHREVLGWPWTTILAFTKIIVSLELINGGSLQLASAPTWILLQGNPCPKSNPTLLCNWYKNQIPVLPGEPSFLNDWSTGSIMEFVGNIFGNHLPEALTVPQSVMVKQKWEFSGENFFFSVSSSVSVISLPQGVKSTHLSLSLSLSSHLVIHKQPLIWLLITLPLCVPHLWSDGSLPTLDSALLISTEVRSHCLSQTHCAKSLFK